MSSSAVTISNFNVHRTGDDILFLGYSLFVTIHLVCPIHCGNVFYNIFSLYLFYSLSRGVLCFTSATTPLSLSPSSSPSPPSPPLPLPLPLLPSSLSSNLIYPLLDKGLFKFLPYVYFGQPDSIFFLLPV